MGQGVDASLNAVAKDSDACGAGVATGGARDMADGPEPALDLQNGDWASCCGCSCSGWVGACGGLWEGRRAWIEGRCGDESGALQNGLSVGHRLRSGIERCLVAILGRWGGWCGLMVGQRTEGGRGNDGSLYRAVKGRTKDHHDDDGD